MSIPSKTKRFVYISTFSRLQTLFFISQRSQHTVADNLEKARFHSKNGFNSLPKPSSVIDIKTWKRVDSRRVGVDSSMIPRAPEKVLKKIYEKGFGAYLVGGCVRDLLRRRTPKDFDIITTANLQQIERIFRRARIVGQRFPVCLVYMHGSVIEVTSFDTVAKQDLKKKPVLLSEMPNGCNKLDFVLWKNSLRRDFTINSLFYNPCTETIYDFVDGMRDLNLQEVRTVARAKDSFKEDCARILRGLRIAARLGFSFSKETAIAIRDLSSSIMNLEKGRLMMEMNYMLSYGAAEKSLYLLGRFKLLDMLLPFQAAYLAEEDPNQSAQSSLMLMKLFSSMDKLLSCDRPCHFSLWVALLAFHMALVNHPQNAHVIWAFSSLLYYGNWREAVNFARESAQMHVQFVPEISEAHGTATDEALVKDVTHFASLVISSIEALTDPVRQHDSMTRYPSYPCHALIFISKRVHLGVARLFDDLVYDIKSYNEKRNSFEINYYNLGNGYKETRFVLGQVIMDAMSSRVIQEQQSEAVEEHHLPVSYVKEQLRVDEEKSPRPEEFNLGQQHDGFKVIMDTMSSGVDEEKSFRPEEFNLGQQHDGFKVIMDAMSSGVIQEQQPEVVDEHHLPASYVKKQLRVDEEKSFRPEEFNLGQQHDGLKEENERKPASYVGKGRKVVEKRKSHPIWGKLEGQLQSDKMGKLNQPVSKPEQLQGVDKEEVKVREPLSKPASYLGKGQKVVEKRKSHPARVKLGGQREPNKMGKCNQPVSNPEQLQGLGKEEVRFPGPLSNLFRMGSQFARRTAGGGQGR